MAAEQIENLILGTGPSAIAAAFALRRLGVPFEILDVAFDLEPERETLVQKLAASDPGAWPQEFIPELFPPPVTSARGGVEKRLYFGSDFPYRRPEVLSCATTDCTVDLSHGLGGFGNVWGAATLPYADHDLKGWPISSADLADSYRNLAEFVPMSAERDRLRGFFPLYREHTSPLQQSEQTRALLNFLGTHDSTMQSAGISYGRSRIAVDSTGGATSCRYCGHCLDGCPYGSMFNPRLLAQRLEQEGIKIHKGLYALEFSEEPNGVVLSTAHVRDGSLRTFRANRLFVGLGTLSTTRLIARSLKLTGKPIRIQDSQYFFFPVLSYRKAHDVTVRFTLADIFLEILNSEVAQDYVHFQVYGLSEMFRDTLRAMFPAPLRTQSLLRFIESRFYLFQGFLNSADSGHLELTVMSSADAKDQMHVRGVLNPESMRVARRAKGSSAQESGQVRICSSIATGHGPPGAKFSRRW